MEVEQLIKKSLKELKDISWENSNATVNQNSRLIFPQTRKDVKRISEQEARFLFVRELEKQNDFYYSVETPTKQIYNFQQYPKIVKSEDAKPGEKSASIDVTVYAKNENNKFIRKHLIEFKFDNVDTCEKDFLKLLCDDETKINYYINILDNTHSDTLTNLEKKFNKAFENIISNANNKIKSNFKILVFIYGENKTNENNLIEYEYDFETDKIIKIINTEKI